MNPFDFTNKTVMITGASKGIGQGIAIYLSRFGAKIVAVARDEQRLKDTVAQLDGKGHFAISCDLSDPEKLPAWMKEVAKQTGPLYGLVHSAGIMMTRPINVLSYKNWTDLEHINLGAALMLSKGFRQNGVYEKAGSSIVFLSSVSGMKGHPGAAGYAATKGALIAVTRALARELVAPKIRVNCVSPALIQTEMASEFADAIPSEAIEMNRAQHPMGYGNVEDVAYSIAFLMAPAAKYITGVNLPIDGGYTC